MDAWWRWGNVVADAILAGNGGPSVVERLQKDRLRRLVQWARRASPLYAELYADVPEHRPLRLADLPPVTRAALMARFDDWVTDREVTLDRVNAFVADPRHVGHPFRDKYAVFTSSGTTGIPGLFVQDPDALAVGDYHLKNAIVFALTGRARGTDEEMLDLLEPYTGQRGRAARLLLAVSPRPPKFGPRQRVLPMSRW